MCIRDRKWAGEHGIEMQIFTYDNGDDLIAAHTDECICLLYTSVYSRLNTSSEPAVNGESTVLIDPLNKTCLLYTSWKQHDHRYRCTFAKIRNASQHLAIKHTRYYFKSSSNGCRNTKIGKTQEKCLNERTA